MQVVEYHHPSTHKYFTIGQVFKIARVDASGFVYPELRFYKMKEHALYILYENEVISDTFETKVAEAAEKGENSRESDQ